MTASNDTKTENTISVFTTDTSDIGTAILAQMRELAEADLAHSDNVLVQGLLRKELIANNFTIEGAEKIALSITIDIEGVLSEEQIAELAKHYAVVCGKLYDGYVAQGFQDAIEAVCKMSPQLSLSVK